MTPNPIPDIQVKLTTLYTKYYETNVSRPGSQDAAKATQ